MGRVPSLRAKYSASYCTPGCTRIVTCSGSNAHGSFEFTPPSNCTVTQRSLAARFVAATSAGPCCRRTPNTFRQAMLYSGTSAKVKANAPSATPSILPRPMPLPLPVGGVRSPVTSLLVVPLDKVAVGQVAVADHRRRGEGVVRRRRRHGPLQALGAFPGARGSRGAVALGTPQDEEHQERRDEHAERADRADQVPVREHHVVVRDAARHAGQAQEVLREEQ